MVRGARAGALVPVVVRREQLTDFASGKGDCAGSSQTKESHLGLPSVSGGWSLAASPNF